jgi:hypothetical protein
MPAGTGAQLISDAMGLASKIAGRIGKLQDASRAETAVSSFRNDLLETDDLYKVKYGDNPDLYNRQITEYAAKAKQNALEKSGLSFGGKNQLNSLLNNVESDFSRNILKNQRQMQVNNFELDLKNATAKNADSAYVYGKDGDYDSFERMMTAEIPKLAVMGSAVLPPKFLNDAVAKAKRQNYISYANGRAETDLDGIVRELEEGFYRGRLPEGDIDNMLDRFRKVQGQNQRSDKNPRGRYDDGTYLNLNLTYDNLSAQKQDDKKNFLRDVNSSIPYLADYNNRIETARAQEKISDSDYKKYRKQVNDYYYDIARANIGKDKESVGNFKDPLFSNTALQKALTIVNNNTSDFQQYDRNDLYGKIMLLAGERGVDLNSDGQTAKQEAKKLAEYVVAEYYNVNPDEQNAMDRVRKKYYEEAQREKIDMAKHLSNPGNIVVEGLEDEKLSFVKRKYENYYASAGLSKKDANILAENNPISNTVEDIKDYIASSVVNDIFQNSKKNVIKNSKAIWGLIEDAADGNAELFKQLNGNKKEIKKVKKELFNTVRKVLAERRLAALAARGVKS